MEFIKKISSSDDGFVIEVKVDNYVDEYTTLKTVPNKQTQLVGKYEGMSLEEIEEKYSKEEAHLVYRICVEQCVDLTKRSVSPTPVETLRTIQIKRTLKEEHNLCFHIMSIKNKFSDEWHELFTLRHQALQLDSKEISVILQKKLRMSLCFLGLLNSG